MAATKVRLSKKELAMAQDAEIILTKNEIVRKLMVLLGELQQEFSEYLRNPGLPAAVIASSAKISRGENYRGMPWLMLDYPRLFDRENIFAIRTMFWWGNFFSITLHLSGVHKKELEDRLIKAYKPLRKAGFYICSNDDQWQHHFGKENYVPLELLSNEDYEQIIAARPFVKIAVKTPLKKWPKVKKQLAGYFRILAGLSSPNGEKGP